MEITVTSSIHAPVEKVWRLWTGTEHIIKWNQASEDWHTPRATNEVQPGGKFSWHMAAKDGSAAFDFEGTYDQVIENKLLAYTITDGRKVTINFSEEGDTTLVTETFEAESMNSVELQQAGWQAILFNFKKYVETNTPMERIEFNITIHASPEKVYTTMLDEKHYQTWTAAFNPTSHYKGNWAKGSKILFIGIDSEGNEGGMVSRIRENIPNEYVSIEHLGVLQQGKEILTGKEVEGWAGSQENYKFVKQGNNTQLIIELDSNAEFKSYFDETYPKALNVLKKLCEG